VGSSGSVEEQQPFDWRMVPPELLAQLDEGLRGLFVWPSWAYVQIRCDWLAFDHWPDVFLYHVEGARRVPIEELPLEIEAIKHQIITRRLLGEEYVT
jgi:hypothetical protein